MLHLFSIPGKGKDYWEEENISEELPACRQMFNIFHPFDPVAYRSVAVQLLIQISNIKSNLHRSISRYHFSLGIWLIQTT